MTNNNDGPRKEKAKTNKPSGEKKPYATIDLEAGAVGKSKTSANEKTARSKDSGSASRKDRSGSASRSTGEATRSESGKKTRSGKYANGNHRGRRGGKNAMHRDSGRGHSRRPQPQSHGEPSLGSILGWLASMLVAGVIGGLIALNSGFNSAPERVGTLPPNFSGSVSDAFEHRVSALESALAIPGSGASQEIEEKFSAVEDRLSGLQALGNEIGSLRDRLGNIENINNELKQELSLVSDQRVSLDRLDRIEKQLGLLKTSDAQGLGALAGTGEFAKKVAEIETTLRAQLDELRSSVTGDVDGKLAEAAQASEEALAGARQVGHQLADVASQSNKLEERIEALNTEKDQLSTSLTELQQSTGDVRASLEIAKDELGERIGMLVKPEDMDELVNPLVSRVGQLEASFEEFLQAEQSRNASAHLIVLSLELADLKRRIDSGESFARELASAERLSNGIVNLDPLLAFSSSGVPTFEELRKEFQPVSYAMINASRKDTDDSILGRIWRSAKSVVQVRKVDHAPDDNSVEAIVARMEGALEAENLVDVLQHSEKLSEDVLVPARIWLKKVNARQTIDNALKSVEEQLKASFTPEPTTSEPAPEAEESQAN